MSPPPAPPLARRLTVLYASETGTAEQVAGRIGRVARRRRVDAHVHSLGDYDKARAC